MEKNELQEMEKELLRKQLELLSEASGKCEDDLSLACLALAMARIYEALYNPGRSGDLTPNNFIRIFKNRFDELTRQQGFSQ